MEQSTHTISEKCDTSQTVLNINKEALSKTMQTSSKIIPTYVRWNKYSQSTPVEQ